MAFHRPLYAIERRLRRPLWPPRGTERSPVRSRPSTRKTLMHNQRYSVKREQDGTWTVFDVFTGEPAVIGPDKLSSQLSPEEADEVVGLLNLLDAIRRDILEEPPPTIH